MTGEIPTQIGTIGYSVTSRGLARVTFGTIAAESSADPAAPAMQRRVEAALRRYFAGDASAIDDVPVDLAGTPFQKKVWNALRRIPAGETKSYGEVARMIGRPTASRAVGAANRANPVPIVVPCHRVIAADGSLHGYGGRLDRKAWLLKHEGWSKR